MNQGEVEAEKARTKLLREKDDDDMAHVKQLLRKGLMKMRDS